MIRKVILAGATGLLVGLAPAASVAEAQFERVYHPFYLPAPHNWEFRNQYPAIDRLFNAFDFGHGILYETLLTRPDAPVELLEEEIYDRLTKNILLNPPRLPMPERSFMPQYARLVPRAKQMFEWAHILHRQTYDILADDRIQDKDAAMQEVLDYYLSHELAFTDVPKGMEIMDEQYFSKEFRERYPKFNGLIWAYHWLQVAVYEPLMVYDTPEERQAAMTATVARFWQMLEDPPANLPTEMPMTPAIAPEFTARYPRFAAIFDNLHMMHDVISDILVSDLVENRRRVIYEYADYFREPAFLAVSDEEWIQMALAHGVDAQGGPAVGFMPPAPTSRAAPGHHEHGHEHHTPREPGHEQHREHETEVGQEAGHEHHHEQETKVRPDAGHHTVGPPETRDARIELMRSVPGKDTVLTESPSEVRLWFSDVPREDGTSIRILDASGESARVHVMPAAADPQDARVRFAEIHGALAPGAYSIDWSVVARDGVEVRGEIPFTIRPR